MIELLSGGLLGSLAGGLFRLAPELFKLLDKRGERAHELAMFEHQCALERERGAVKLAEVGAVNQGAADLAVLEAFKAAQEQQAEATKAAGKFAASMSALVRPLITYWVFGLFAVINTFLAWGAFRANLPAADMAKILLTPDFLALVSGTINYWFLDRTLTKRGL
jgi:hypothetical protein